jgi:protein-L-isoaspartate(D-aspartate) O-methyltransferase
MDKRNKEAGDEHVTAELLNRRLVDDLVERGQIRSAPVEAAFRSVLRHHFVPGVSLEDAYSDRAIALQKDEEGGWESSSSQPGMMAIMLEQLDLWPGQRVLEIGTGSGYNAALLAQIVGDHGKVYSVEIEAGLAAAARDHLRAAGVTAVEVIAGDGGYGYGAGSPYDRIMLTTAAEDIAPAWWAQLATDGRVVMPLQLAGVHRSVAFVRSGDHLRSVSTSNCGFILMRGAFGVDQEQKKQIGPDPQLSLDPVTAGNFDGDTIYNWLRGTARNRDSGVVVTLSEIVFGLQTWLTRESGLGQLEASGALAEGALVPPIARIDDGRKKVALTIVLAAGAGMAALARAPGEEVPFRSVSVLFSGDEHFPLCVRQFGADPRPAEKLVAHIRAWDAAGRPLTAAVRIRAYPGDATYAPAPDEVLIQKRWTQFVLDWPGDER